MEFIFRMSCARNPGFQLRNLLCEKDGISVRLSNLSIFTVYLHSGNVPESRFPRKMPFFLTFLGPDLGSEIGQNSPPRGGVPKPVLGDLYFFCTFRGGSQRKTLLSGPGFPTIPNRKIHLLEGHREGTSCGNPVPGGIPGVPGRNFLGISILGRITV